MEVRPGSIDSSWLPSISLSETASAILEVSLENLTSRTECQSDKSMPDSEIKPGVTEADLPWQYQRLRLGDCNNPVFREYQVRVTYNPQPFRF